MKPRAMSRGFYLGSRDIGSNSVASVKTEANKEMAAKLREEVIDRVLDCLERGFSPALVTCRAASARARAVAVQL